MTDVDEQTGAVVDAAARRSPRWLVVLVIALAALFVIVLFFAIGRRLPWFDAGNGSAGAVSETGPGASIEPSVAGEPGATIEPDAAGGTGTVPATPSVPSVTAVPAGPAAPGASSWTALRGGECLEPYVSPWEETFTVADCAAPHAAEVVARASLSDDPAAAYPGEAAITSQLNLACTAPTVLDYAAAKAYSDLQWQAGYPVSAEQWASGVREYSCFVSRAMGEPLTGSLRVAP